MGMMRVTFVIIVDFQCNPAYCIRPAKRFQAPQGKRLTNAMLNDIFPEKNWAIFFMFIRDLFRQKRLTLSFVFFPPKREGNLDSLLAPE